MEPSTDWEGVPSRPSRDHYGSPRAMAAMAQHLSGFPTLFAGLPELFVHSLFGRRADLFNRQSVHIDGDVIRVYCEFYERLWSADELITAMEMGAALLKRGIEWRLRPIQELIIQIFPSMFDAPSGAVPLPDADERSLGNHAVVPSHIKDGRLFFWHNWDPRWGDNGIGSFSFDYLKRFAQEAWSVRFLPGPKPADPVSSSLGVKKRRAAQLLSYSWNDKEKATNCSWDVLHRGAAIDFAGRWLTAFGEGSTLLQCVAILREAEGGPLIVGWMHVRETPRGTEVEELFVWPHYRRRGIGTALAGQVLFYEHAIFMQRRNLIWRQMESDVLVRRKAPLKAHLPRWLRNLPWGGNPRMAFLPYEERTKLLGRLARLQAADGLHLQRRLWGSRILETVCQDAACQHATAKIRGFIEAAPIPDFPSGAMLRNRTGRR